MGVGGVVEAGVHHLDVALGNERLLVELLAQESLDKAQVAVEQPADYAQGKHVAALEHALVVHAAVGQAGLNHLRHRAGHHAVGVDAHLAEVVVGGKLGLLKVFRAEAVGVDDDRGLRLCKAILCLQGGGIHGHKHVALVARGVDTARSDVHLKTRHARERALRGAYVGRVVGKRGYAVAHSGRHRGEDVAGQLHAVAGIT